MAAKPHEPAVLIVIDEIRASTTLVTLIDLGCDPVYVEGGVAAARRLARATGSVLVGERHARRPTGFDFDNSPVALNQAGVRGGSAVLSTTNGTAILRRFRRGEWVLVGCLRNARACAEAALRLATDRRLPIRVVCAGQSRRFVIEDAVAAGEIVRRIVDAAAASGAPVELTDAAMAAVRLAASYPDTRTALDESDGGRTLRRIGAVPDIGYCAETDASQTVPVLRDGRPMRIVPLPAADRG